MVDLGIDYKFWGFITSLVTLAGVILTAILNKLANDKIMNNHLHHLAIDVKDIKVVQKEQGTSIQNLALNIANLEGKQQITEKFMQVAKISRNSRTK